MMLRMADVRSHMVFSICGYRAKPNTLNYITPPNPKKSLSGLSLCALGGGGGGGGTNGGGPRASKKTKRGVWGGGGRGGGGGSHTQ